MDLEVLTSPIATLVAAFMGFWGALLVVRFQVRSAERLRQRESMDRLRSEASVAFLRAVAAVAVSQRGGDIEDLRKAMTMLTDAKARISVYGDADVVTATSAFFRHHGALETRESMQSFTELVMTMRLSALPDEEAAVSREDVSRLLLDEDLR